MNRHKHIIKIIGINAGVVLAVIGLVVSIPIGLIQSYNILTRIVPVLDVGFESSLVTDYSVPHEQSAYEGLDWAEQHFKDLNEHETISTDFLGWRYAPLDTPTINISTSGIRKTVNPVINDRIDHHIYWMFGGSTMFGWGSNDTNTIPSILANSLSSEAVNFGTDAYIALQGVVRLASEYGSLEVLNDPPHTVIFMDGINDVDRLCRIQTNSNLRRGYRWSTPDTYVHQVADPPFVLKSVALTPSWLLQPALTLIDKFRDSKIAGFLGNDPTDVYLCDDRREIAQATAASLVSDWSSAKSIAEQNGDRFLAVLQPVSYLSEIQPGQLQNVIYGVERRKQYQIVYPIIQRLAHSADIEFLDLTEILDGREDVYIDSFHYSPRGNEYIVEAIIGALANRGWVQL